MNCMNMVLSTCSFLNSIDEELVKYTDILEAMGFTSVKSLRFLQDTDLKDTFSLL